MLLGNTFSFYLSVYYSFLLYLFAEKIVHKLDLSGLFKTMPSPKAMEHDALSLVRLDFQGEARVILVLERVFDFQR